METVGVLWLGALPLFLLGFIAGYLYQNIEDWWSGGTDVYIFPEIGPCNHYLKRGYCNLKGCNYQHGKGNYYKIFKLICSAERSIDVCMYRIAFREVTDKLIKLKNQKGIRIRVVSDKSYERDDGEVGDSYKNLQRLADAGIQVKARRLTDQKNGFMHNKFVIIDDSRVIHGSANWTNGAITNNDETVFTSNRWLIVRKFRNNFETLFRHPRMDPIIAGTSPQQRRIIVVRD